MAKRKIIVHIATSADGFIARRDGSVDWLEQPRFKGDYGMGQFYTSIDTILWGRNTYDMAIEFQKKGVHMLDAPVSGGPRGAESRRLALWVGGDEQIFNRHKKVLDAIGDQARYIGPIGAGSVAKLVHNCAGYAIQTCLAEVFTMGVKAGVEPLALWEAVRQGAGGRRRTFDALGDHFLTDSYDPPDFALRLAHKDVTLATELARELKVPMPMANLAHGELTAALNRGWDGRDSRVAMQLQKERAGVTIKVDPAEVKAALERDGK